MRKSLLDFVIKDNAINIDIWNTGDHWHAMVKTYHGDYAVDADYLDALEERIYASILKGKSEVEAFNLRKRHELWREVSAR